MKKIIEFDEVCKACKGTGLYVGMAERDGSAVVCHSCNGTGCFHFKHEYEPFTHRKDIRGVERVFQVNPGICIGEGKNNEWKLSDFGGMPFNEWAAGLPFKSGMENRQFTCPAWWYQSADYSKKPEWDECRGFGAFSGCDNFNNKSKCWERWDNEKF